ncbi:MAG: trk system potassium uptake protein TrkA [Candidatus Kentron sp. G]|nr:MAG: trk system potassium uptake protein TrkA [Candidatus Kentron sp. G]VFM97528.1 MAG: trk system potassium uptake protein TrkA [Candidatus Kentron sp. G]VFM99556.1 MAG: trk system potassium uptake protein TrkA [Candidatus Kentron sp. G]
MKIIILGAGRVGSSVAENLVSEANDITVVDQSPELLRELQDRLDLRTVLGHASHPDILARAGAGDADMVLAVTNSDETNMIACQIAYTLFNVSTKIARVRAVAYHDYPIFSQESVPIDALINPEQLVTTYIQQLIKTPGALQVLQFANGRVSLVAVKAYYGGPLVDHELRTLPNLLHGIDTRVIAVFRRGEAIIPEGKTVIDVDDEVFFIAASKNVQTVMRSLRKLDKPVKRIMLAGGGNIGTRLASALETDYTLKLIEKSEHTSFTLSEKLAKTIVLRGNAADADLLREEDIDKTDVFCALTDDDQLNILSAMLAKRMGATKVMALINRGAYVDLVEESSIDIAILPQNATIGALLAHVRRGDVVVVHSLRRGAAEAIEAVAHGTSETSSVVGRAVENIPLPPDTIIGAIVRGKRVIIAHHDTTIAAEDHVILFMLDKRHAPEVERLFQMDGSSL